jgi:mannose-6-phosphate isomerase-like protein (cupin superfamily)
MGVTYSEERPWGAWYVLDEGPRFKVKKILVKPGKRLSLQSHRFREEHWTVVSGEAVVEVDDIMYQLGSGQMITVPMGAKHRLSNTTAADLLVIEVQLGQSTAEDDITRYADDYGRP